MKSSILSVSLCFEVNLHTSERRHVNSCPTMVVSDALENIATRSDSQEIGGIEYLGVPT